MATEDLKQGWNNTNVVATTVVTIAVAILAY